MGAVTAERNASQKERCHARIAPFSLLQASTRRRFKPPKLRIPFGQWQSRPTCRPAAIPLPSKIGLHALQKCLVSKRTLRIRACPEIDDRIVMRGPVLGTRVPSGTIQPLAPSPAQVLARHMLGCDEGGRRRMRRRQNGKGYLGRLRKINGAMRADTAFPSDIGQAGNFTPVIGWSPGWGMLVPGLLVPGMNP